MKHGYLKIHYFKQAHYAVSSTSLFLQVSWSEYHLLIPAFPFLSCTTQNYFWHGNLIILSFIIMFIWTWAREQNKATIKPFQEWKCFLAFTHTTHHMFRYLLHPRPVGLSFGIPPAKSPPSPFLDKSEVLPWLLLLFLGPLTLVLLLLLLETFPAFPKMIKYHILPQTKRTIISDIWPINS
jgi:hypothetical protein